MRPNRSSERAGAVGTTSPAVVPVDRPARLLREALTHCRRDVSIPLRDAHVRNLIKRVEHGRAHPCEHIVTLLRDAFDRNAPRAGIEGFPRTLLALIADWYAAPDMRQLSLTSLIRLETAAQAAADVAELELALTPSAKAIGDATDALRQHLVALEQLVAACERTTIRAVA